MTPATIKPAITLDVLNQIDVRVGTILSVADVANSDNLMQLRVDFGDHERTIVAGIRKERVNPREIEGRQALFVVNLQPRKMRGVFRKECCSTSDTAMASRPCCLCRRARFPMELARASCWYS